MRRASYLLLLVGVCVGADCQGWPLCGCPSSWDSDGDCISNDNDPCPDDPTNTCVVIETVTVGNAGNTGDEDHRGYGGVDYTYAIGKYEVTAGQYTKFLNAVAATDTYRLYRTTMWSHDEGCKIERIGSSGSYRYRVASDRANRPVCSTGWGNAARFANWLHNGQPTGEQDLTTTEDGSYFVNGATNMLGFIDVLREPDATWVIPSEDEWYKAAYHKNDGVTGNYFDYSTGSDSEPSNALDLGGNNATFEDAGYTIGSPYWRTEVGAHENSNSPYGTFDQGGNVWEWNEAVIRWDYGNGDSGVTRGMRGGGYENAGSNTLLAVYRTIHGDDVESTSLNGDGFRLAKVR